MTVARPTSGNRIRLMTGLAIVTPPGIRGAFVIDGVVLNSGFEFLERAERLEGGGDHAQQRESVGADRDIPGLYGAGRGLRQRGQGDENKAMRRHGDAAP